MLNLNVERELKNESKLNNNVTTDFDCIWLEDATLEEKEKLNNLFSKAKTRKHKDVDVFIDEFIELAKKYANVPEGIAYDFCAKLI